MPQRTGPVVAACMALTLLATAGCGLPLLPPPPEEEPLFPGVEEAVQQSQGRVEPPVVERLNFRTGEPTAVFGRREVARGYAEAVWFASATTFAAQTLVPGPMQNEGAFTRHTSRMTAEMAETTTETVADCYAGDTDACGQVHLWRFYYLAEEEDYQFQLAGPVLVDHVIHEAGLWVDRSLEEPQLAVRFEQRGDLRVRRNGEDVLVPLVKDATYWLVPAPEGTGLSWQIDHIDVQWVELPAVPDTGRY